MALAILLMLPEAIHLLLVIIRYMFEHEGYGMLLAGMMIYWFFWLLYFRRHWTGHWFSVLEHELTHALFAFLTFQRITALAAHSHAGGRMWYQGRGNWLIAISPYFFPTFSLFILAVMLLSKPSLYPLMSALLGFSLSHRLYSNWRQCHYRQPDFHEVGFVFVWIFLPAANILMLLIIFAALPQDTILLSDILSRLKESLLDWLTFFLREIVSFFR